MTWEGKLECFFWTKGCCGIGVWRDLWSLYSGQSRRRIGFPECFALTLCSPSTAGKRPHLPDTHTHTRAESDNRKQDSAMALKSWGFKEKEISCSFSPLFHLHFTAIKEEGEGGTKWPLRGSGFDYPHTQRDGERNSIWGRKRELVSGELSKNLPVWAYLWRYGFEYVKIYIRSDWFGTLFISINSKWHTKVVVLTKSHKRCDSRSSPIKSNFSKLLS